MVGSRLEFSTCVLHSNNRILFSSSEVTSISSFLCSLGLLIEFLRRRVACSYSTITGFVNAQMSIALVRATSRCVGVSRIPVFFFCRINFVRTCTPEK